MNVTSMKMRVLLLGLGVVSAVALQGCVVDPDESDEDEPGLAAQSHHDDGIDVDTGDDDGIGNAYDSDDGHDSDDGYDIDDEGDRDDIALPAGWNYSLPLPPGQKTRARRAQTSRVGEDPPPEPW